MNRPSKVIIGPHTYDILWGEGSWKKYAKGSDDNDIGQTLVRENKLLIKGWDLALSQAQDTLLHEILHAIFRTWGWSGLDFGKGHDLEEAVVSVTTPHLLQVLRDNPKVYEWLVSNDE